MWWRCSPVRSQHPRQHLLCQFRNDLLLLSLVVGPGLGVPDFQARVGPDDHAVPVEAGVGAQVGRYGDPTLPVGKLVGGAREEDTAVIAYRFSRDGGCAEDLGDPFELPDREDVEAAFLPLGHHQPAREFVAVLRGKEHASLLIETRRVRAEKHRLLHSRVTATTLSSTWLHCTPLSSTVNSKPPSKPGETRQNRR